MSARGSRYMIYIDLVKVTYTIRNVISARRYEGGEDITNMNVLKRKIKAHLEHLGCEFDKESRMRTFGLCEKSWNQSKEMEKRRQLKAEKVNEQE
jgi:hypothetical protein